MQHKIIIEKTSIQAKSIPKRTAKRSNKIVFSIHKMLFESHTALISYTLKLKYRY